MQRVHDGYLHPQKDLKKSNTGLAIRVFGPTRTEIILLCRTGTLHYDDGGSYGIGTAYIVKPRELTPKEVGKRKHQLGRPTATWMFENDNWNTTAMVTFVRDVHGNLRPDDIYKGTSLGRHNNEVSYQARVLKEGFAGTGLQVHAPTVIAWTAEALLDYAQRIHSALKTLGDHHQQQARG